MDTRGLCLQGTKAPIWRWSELICKCTDHVAGNVYELLACAACCCGVGGGALAALDAPVSMDARTVASQYNDNKVRCGGNYISSGVSVAVLIAGGCASARAMHLGHVQSRAFTATCGSPHSFSSAQDGQ